jgi:hypothetical protein
MLTRTLTTLGLALALAAGTATAAEQTFDGIPSGTVINTFYPGLTLREPLSNGTVPITVVSYGGGNVLSLNGNIAFNATEGAIDVHFATPQRSVSIAAAAHREVWYIGNALNRPFMEAYDANGAFLGRVLYQGPLPGSGATMPFETLKFVSASANIARIRLSSQASQGGSPIDGIFDTLAYSLTTEPTGTLFDDFSSANARWTLSSAGTGIQGVVNGGRLVFYVDPAIIGTDVYQRWTAASCLVRGDFDLRVDYEVSGGQSGVRAALIADGAGHVERSSLSKHDIYSAGEYYITNISGYVPGFVPTADNRGALRLARSGNLMTSYYRSAGSNHWNAIYTQYVTTADVPFALQVWTHSWAYTNQGAKVSFDNLILASGSFTGKGCLRG